MRKEIQGSNKKARLQLKFQPHNPYGSRATVNMAKGRKNVKPNKKNCEAISETPPTSREPAGVQACFRKPKRASDWFGDNFVLATDNLLCWLKAKRS